VCEIGNLAYVGGLAGNGASLFNREKNGVVFAGNLLADGFYLLVNRIYKEADRFCMEVNRFHMEEKGVCMQVN
jgi:hypothetical protein